MVICCGAWPPSPRLVRVACSRCYARESYHSFSFGSPHPCVAVLEQDGVLRVRELVVDPGEAEAAAKAAMAEGGCWMPEQYYALGRPTGRVFIEAPTRLRKNQGISVATGMVMPAWRHGGLRRVAGRRGGARPRHQAMAALMHPGLRRS